MNSNSEQNPQVFPAKSDDELWQQTLKFLNDKYRERVQQDHARIAFEATCDELEDYLPLQSFLRKVATKWMWQRPSLPRGMSGDKGWREIRPANLPEDYDKK